MVKIFPFGDVTTWDFSSQYSSHHGSRQPFSLVTLIRAKHFNRLNAVVQQRQNFGSAPISQPSPLFCVSNVQLSLTFFPGHGVLHVCLDDAHEVVRLDRPLLLLHQLRQHQTQRRHQAGEGNGFNCLNNIFVERDTPGISEYHSMHVASDSLTLTRLFRESSMGGTRVWSQLSN